MAMSKAAGLLVSGFLVTAAGVLDLSQSEAAISAPQQIEYVNHFNKCTAEANSKTPAPKDPEDDRYKTASLFRTHFRACMDNASLMTKVSARNLTAAKRAGYSQSQAEHLAQCQTSYSVMPANESDITIEQAHNVDSCVRRASSGHSGLYPALGIGALVLAGGIGFGFARNRRL